MDGRAWRIAGLCLVVLTAAGPIRAVQVVVQVENLSETDGFWLSPMWIGFHDGGFDLFDEGAHIKPGGALERLAEDGNAQPLVAEFTAQVPKGVTGIIEAPGGIADLVAFGPGETARMQFEVDPLSNRFMSFAAMVMPSNDAFIGNDSPHAFPIFSESGGFLQPFVIHLNGCDVWDAGTELNTQKDAGFFDQTVPNTGITTVAPVERHEGFIKPYPTTPIILGGTNNLGIFFDPETADFVAGNRPVCRITVIPEPATLILLATGGLVLLRRNRRPA